MNERQEIILRKGIRESLHKNKKLMMESYLICEDIENINFEMNGLNVYDPKVIEENIMDIFGGGMVSAFKQQAVEYIADAMDIDKDSIVARFLINFIENFEILGMGQYFGEGKCEAIPKLVAKAGLETLTELQGKKLIELLYYAITGKQQIESPELLERLDKALGGLVAAAGREIINELIYSFIGPVLEPKLKAVFCEYSGLKDFLYKGVYQGNLKNQLGDLAKTGAIAGAAGIGVDAALDSGEKALDRRDDAARAGTGASLAQDILGVK